MIARLWTPEEDARLVALYGVATNAAIGEKLVSNTPDHSDHVLI